MEDAPLEVIRGSRAEYVAVLDALRSQGWVVREGWQVRGLGPDLTGTRIVCAGPVRTREDASAAVVAAAAGAGVVAHVDADEAVVADLIEDLARLGDVRFRQERSADPSVLTDEQRQLLTLLGDGLTLEEAAQRAHLSRRTAARRLAEAKRALGVSSTVEAIELAERTGGDG